MLAIPDESRPQYTIYRDASGTWWLEEVDADTEICPSERMLRVGDDEYRIVAPNRLDPTSEFVPRKDMAGTELLFLTGNKPDELCIDAICNGVAVHLENRAFHHLLLELARFRMRDQQRGANDEDAGWVTKDALIRHMGFTEGDLNIQIYRARKQLAAADVEGASGLIERRSREGLIRIGVSRLAMRPLASKAP